jgi:hypothetical protein
MNPFHHAALVDDANNHTVILVVEGSCSSDSTTLTILTQGTRIYKKLDS